MIKNNKFIGAGILTAGAASLCCITPVLALIAGSNVIIPGLLWIDPLRPYLIAISILLIGIVWFRKMMSDTTDNCNCDTSVKQKFIHTKSFLGLVTVGMILIMAIPYYTSVLYPRQDQKTNIFYQASRREMNLKIEGMTCSACEKHIKQAVNKLDGIVKLNVSYKNSQALITFDTNKTSSAAIQKAVETTGYTVIKSILK